MSAKLSQPTPWKYVPWHVEEDSDAVRDANNDLVCCVAGSDIANLIAEAGTVYHETGLTPRQLLDLANKHREQAQVYLEQREGLLQAAKSLLGDIRWLKTSIADRVECAHCGRQYDETEDEALPDFCSDDCPGEIARAAITRATTGEA